MLIRSQVDCTQLDRVMWPCNVNNSHWVLVVAFVQEKKIAVYDSLGPGYHREKAKHNVIQTLFECTWFPTSCVIIVVPLLAGCAAIVAPDGLPLRHPPVAAPYACFYGHFERAHAAGHRRHHCSDHANQNCRVDRLRSHLDAAQLGHGKFASQLPTWGQNTQQFIHNASTRMARVVHLCPCLWDRRVVNLRTRAVIPTCDAVAPGPCRSTRPQPYPS